MNWWTPVAKGHGKLKLALFEVDKVAMKVTDSFYSKVICLEKKAINDSFTITSRGGVLCYQKI